MKWFKEINWIQPKKYSELTEYKDPLIKFLLSLGFLFTYSIPLKINFGVFTGFFRLFVALLIAASFRVFFVSLYEIFMVFYNKHHRFKPKTFSIDDVLEFVYVIPQVELEALIEDDVIRFGTAAEFNNNQRMFGNDPIYRNKVYYISTLKINSPKDDSEDEFKVFPNRDYLRKALTDVFENEITVKSVNGFNPKIIDIELREFKKRKKRKK